MAFSRIKFTFFCIISLVLSYCSFIVRFVCFSSQNFLSFECLWKIRFLLYRFWKSSCMSLHDPHCTNLDRLCRICGNIPTWEKDIAESKGHNPVKKCTFYQYHQRFTVLYPPKICVKCFFLRNTASKRNIKHHISLKTYENWCPYDNHLYSTCERITKLNKEAPGKIKNTSKNDWRGCPSPLKFDQ